MHFKEQLIVVGVQHPPPTGSGRYDIKKKEVEDSNRVLKCPRDQLNFSIDSLIIWDWEFSGEARTDGSLGKTTPRTAWRPVFKS